MGASRDPSATAHPRVDVSASYDPPGRPRDRRTATVLGQGLTISFAIECCIVSIVQSWDASNSTGSARWLTCGRREVTKAADIRHRVVRRKQSMIRPRRPQSLRWTKSVAVVALSFLLLGGLLGAGHFHKLPPQGISAPASGSHTADGLCALCVARFQSSTLASSAPPTTIHLPTVSILSPVARSVPSLHFRSPLFGRAPPASL